MTALDIALLVALVVYAIVGAVLLLLAQREVPGVNEPRRYVGGPGGDRRWAKGRVDGGSLAAQRRREMQRRRRS